MSSLPRINHGGRKSFSLLTTTALQILTLVLLFAATLSGIFTSQAQTVSADFGGRTAATPVVPSGLFAVNGVGSTLNDTGAISTLTTAGLNGTRFWIQIDQIFATSTPNYNYLDRYLTTMQNTGLHPIAVITGTPPSLGSSACAAPSNASQWGQMAKSVVAHIDQKFPGMVQDYEIWNEPENTASLCVSSSTTALNTYVSIFASAAPAMHAQAQTDGQTIRTGGPVIADMTQASTWLPALLNNASTASYVNFVSFHLYITGQNEINSGMQWSGLYSITQSSTSGLGHYYNLIESLVRAGKQPNAASTPIYVSEFNTNWVYAVDHLRNDPTYGPLWNSLAISDFLNVAYNGATALPSRLAYFMSFGKYFCIMGQWDTDMDCNQAAMEPYPQFYAFKLFASPNYLDLQGGGRMAAWVSPGSTKSGLSATAFYTDTTNNIVITNPTSTAYNAVPVSLINPGLTSATGTLYLPNSSNPQITTESVSLTSSGGTYSATVAVPAYSTVAVSLTGTVTPSTNPVTPPPPPPAPVPPVPVLNVTPTSGTAPLMVTIDSSASQGGNGDAITGRTIDFGDGTWVNAVATTTHTYTKVGSYTVKLTLKNEDNLTATTTRVVTIAAPAPTQIPGLQFIPVTPCRVADTRNPTGQFGGPEMSAGSTRVFDIPQSACGIPSTAAAYSLNVTVVPSGTLGYLTLWPAGKTQPAVSTLNSDGRIKANAAIVAAGTSGGVSVYVTNTTQVILDINGYFAPAGTASALAFYPVTPCRVADTRNPSGPLGGPTLSAGTSRAFPVLSSSCGIPSTAQAYSLNVTAVPHGTLGHLTTWPTGEMQPVVSTLNSPTGEVVSNAAIVPAGSGGEISVYATNNADVVLDINGYFAPPETGGLLFYAVTSCQVIDTRTGKGAFSGVLTVNVDGSTCAPPSTAQGYVFNATVVPSGPLGYLTLWPNGEPKPVVSTLNASDGVITSNMAIVPTTNGSINAFATNPTNLILDISGYFAP